MQKSNHSEPNKDIQCFYKIIKIAEILHNLLELSLATIYFIAKYDSNHCASLWLH